jgi:hypothetical protein
MNPVLVCIKDRDTLAEEKQPVTALRAISNTKKRLSSLLNINSSAPPPIQNASLMLRSHSSLFVLESVLSAVKLVAPGFPYTLHIAQPRS